MKSQTECKKQLKRSLEEFSHGEEAQESLEDEKAHETIDLSS